MAMTADAFKQASRPLPGFWFKGHEDLCDADRTALRRRARRQLKREADSVLKGLNCTHRRMKYCCHPKNCGHLNCPDCDLGWDEGTEQ